jgi:putative sugar O-methyltransferase
MHSTQLLKSAMTCFRTVESIYKSTGYGDSYQLNLFWANQNMTDMHRILDSSVDAVEAIQAAGSTYMFSVNTPDSVKEKAVDWHLGRLSRIGIDLFSMPPLVQESEFSNSSNQIERNGRRLTPDFFRHFSAAVEINKYCLTGQRKYKIVELGAGMGDLCRLLKLFHRDCCYVIVDIAETLCFSYMFLRLNFPEANVLYVTDVSQLTGNGIEAFDFVFVPTMFSEALAGSDFDLFLNTASLGEMKNDVIRHWMNFIQTKLKVRYLFTVNRFLNTIIPSQHGWRLDENECSVLYDGNWKILNWELEPPFTRCPYVGTIAARSLEIAAERSPANSPDERKARGQQLMFEVMDEDWVRLEPSFPPEMTYRDNILVNDLTMSGTLFKLWESIRLDPNEVNVQLMLKYLTTLMHRQDREFEESVYYEKLLKSFLTEPREGDVIEISKPNPAENQNERAVSSVGSSPSHLVELIDPQQERIPAKELRDVLRKLANRLQLVYRRICPRTN